MSLTSHLDDKNSPARVFMEEHFPRTRQVLSPVNTRLRRAETTRPAGRPPWMTIGTAFDYRARYFFEITPHEDLIAWKGATRVSDETTMVPVGDNAWIGVGASANGPQLSETAIQSFFNDLDDAVEQIRPSRRQLSSQDEELLNRYCYVLALFEDPGRGRVNPDSPLFRIKNPTTMDLLGLAEPSWVDDLCALGSQFVEHYGNSPITDSVMNPVFEGSRDVGGADADMIVAGCLTDLKCTVQPAIKKEWLYQVLGYALLDYSNDFGIETVGFYMARQGTTISWDLDELVRVLGKENGPGIQESRGMFRKALESSHS